MSTRQRGEARDGAGAMTVAKAVVRLGWRVALLPAAPLPQALRGMVLRAARRAVDTAYRLPLPPREWVDELADELDELESRSASREDLGSRLRREARQRHRRPAEAP